MSSHRLRVLIVTKIFPNAAEPLSSPFNRQQFAALGRLCDVEVLATIPWFPGARALGRWSAAGRLTGVPSSEIIDGLTVRHPRFLFLPKLGHSFSGALYAASLAPLVVRDYRAVDVVMGSWAYPDGAAAVALASLIRVPSVVKLHGSDMNVVATMPGPRQNLRWLLPRAARVVAVSQALADEAARLGVARDRIDVVGNGVDPKLFFPADQAAARVELGLASDGKLLVYVGRLERSKGVLDLLDAFEKLAPVHRDLWLALIGEGAAGDECRRRAARIGAHVIVAGARQLGEVPRWMAASDLVTLPSWNEGSPNVVLEALACGRPVVASRVGGIPEIITSPSLGELVSAHDPDALGAALVRVANREFAPRAIVAASRGSWDDSAAKLHDVLCRAAGQRWERAA